MYCFSEILEKHVADCNFSCVSVHGLSSTLVSSAWCITIYYINSAYNFCLGCAASRTEWNYWLSVSSMTLCLLYIKYHQHCCWYHRCCQKGSSQTLHHWVSGLALPWQERTVRLTKMSGYIKRGLDKNQSIERMDKAWLCWGFQINFMYNAVL